MKKKKYKKNWIDVPEQFDPKDDDYALAQKLEEKVETEETESDELDKIIMGEGIIEGRDKPQKYLKLEEDTSFWKTFFIVGGALLFCFVIFALIAILFFK